MGQWGGLGWLETALKLGGVGVGVAALVRAVGHPADAPAGGRLAEVVILAVLCLGLLAAIADRLWEREIVGVVFILAMNAGHIAMLAALLRDPDTGALLAAFAALMLAGDLVKLVFLATTGFAPRSAPRAVAYGVVGAYVAGYVALILIALA